MSKKKAYFFLGFERYNSKDYSDLFSKEDKIINITYKNDTDISRAFSDQPFRSDLIENNYQLYQKSTYTELFRNFINSNIYDKYISRCYLASSRGRVNKKPLSSQDILEISNAIIFYVCSEINKLDGYEIKYFLCAYLPHSVIDWAIYYVLRFLNINCYSLQEIYNCEKSVIFKNLLDSFDNNKPLNRIRINMENIKNTEISHNITSIKPINKVYYYGKLFTPQYMFGFSKHSPSMQLSKDFVFRIIKQLFIDTKRCLVVLRDNYLKKTNYKRRFRTNPYSLVELIPRTFEYTLFKVCNKPKNILKIKDLQTLDNFIYLPLHYQPEASTEVNFKAYTDQLSFINSVRKIVNKDLNILVKLNPLSQTPRPYKKSFYFWETIEKMDKTFVISEKIPTKELLNKCELVASVAGTACFEANLIGKPSIFGGHSHFSDSPLSINISKLNNIAEFNNWFNSIKNEDTEIKKMKINTYLANLESDSIPGHFHLKGEISDLLHKKIFKNLIKEINKLN